MKLIINSMPKGIIRPELANPATAADFLINKKAILADGNIVTGNARLFKGGV